jgi:hypothetical protein
LRQSYWFRVVVVGGEGKRISAKPRVIDIKQLPSIVLRKSHFNHSLLKVHLFDIFPFRPHLVLRGFPQCEDDARDIRGLTTTLILLNEFNAGIE